jgi:hypothetical protein
MDKNPYGNKNYAFGFQYVNEKGETVTEFSNEYFDPEINHSKNGHMIYGDEAKERNRADFERLQRDTEKAQAEFKATLSRIMKTGILSHVDSLAPVMKGLQRTTRNLVQGDLKQPIDLYGDTSMTRPTPRATSLNPGNSIRKYKRATLKIGGITHEIMTPQAPPAGSVFDPRVAVQSR